LKSDFKKKCIVYQIIKTIRNMEGRNFKERTKKIRKWSICWEKLQNENIPNTKTLTDYLTGVSGVSVSGVRSLSSLPLAANYNTGKTVQSSHNGLNLKQSIKLVRIN